MIFYTNIEQCKYSCRKNSDRIKRSSFLALVLQKDFKIKNFLSPALMYIHTIKNNSLKFHISQPVIPFY